MKSQPFGKVPDAGKDRVQEEKGETGGEMFGCIIDSVDMSLSRLWEMANERETWHPTVHGVKKSRTWLSEGTATNGEMRCMGKPDSSRFNFEKETQGGF